MLDLLQPLIEPLHIEALILHKIALKLSRQRSDKNKDVLEISISVAVHYDMTLELSPL